MIAPRIHPWLALIGLSVGALHGSGAALPFFIDSPDGVWRMTAINRPLPVDLVMEAVVRRSGGNSRFIILSSAKAEPGEEWLKAFVTRLKSTLAGDLHVTAVEKNDAQMGFEGRHLQFELSDDKQAYESELFVFVHEKTGWGVLYLQPKGSPVTAAPFEVLRKDTPVPSDAVALPPFRIQDQPLTGFPISLEVSSNPVTGRVSKILVSDVPPGSITELAGVRIGDEIITVNGKKSEEYASGLGKGTELGLIFLNRKEGDKVQFQLKPRGKGKPRTVTLVIPSTSDSIFRRARGR